MSGTRENSFRPYLRTKELFTSLRASPVILLFIFIVTLDLVHILHVNLWVVLSIISLVSMAGLGLVVYLHYLKLLKRAPASITIGPDALVADLVQGKEGVLRTVVLPFSRINILQGNVPARSLKFPVVGRMAPPDSPSEEIELRDGRVASLGVAFYLINENVALVKAAYNRWADSVLPPAGRITRENDVVPAVTGCLKFLYSQTQEPERYETKVREATVMAPVSCIIEDNCVTGVFLTGGGMKGTSSNVTIPYASVTDVRCFKKGVPHSAFAVVTSLPNPGGVPIEAYRLTAAGVPPRGLVLTAENGYLVLQKLLKFRGRSPALPGQLEGEPSPLPSESFLIKNPVLPSLKEEEFAERIRNSIPPIPPPAVLPL